MTQNLNICEELNLRNSGEKSEKLEFVIAKSIQVVQRQSVTFVAPPPLDPKLNFVELKSDAELSELFDSLISRAESALGSKKVANCVY